MFRAILVAGVLVLTACQSPGSSVPGQQPTATPSGPSAAVRASAAASLAPVVTPTPAAANCAPSYPDFCIPPPPPDLNCADVAPHKNFTVLWNVPDPDPHHFDANKDGIACSG